jgi:hypothetical protein
MFKARASIFNTTQGEQTMIHHSPVFSRQSLCFLAAKFAAVASLLLALPLSAAEAPKTTQNPTASAANCPQKMRYTFSWSQLTECNFNPRGGTSKGAPLTLDSAPHAGWLALQEPGLSVKEKDRRAILAMAGPYRTSFEFLETMLYAPGLERARPYQSWGTEYIYVIDDSDDFISLQHLMVLFTQDDKGELLGPFVQKHWRQDWQYEKAELLVYDGNSVWQHVSVPAAERSGSWAQSVFQVDDSPRYEAIGHWQHEANFSTWLSASTWRPLPRRETTARKDYQVLEGTNRHTILHNGWVQEEENYKVVLDANGNKSASPYLAKELGVNRYERITGFDFSAGDQYWQQTAPFWSDVRSVWREFFAAKPAMTIVEEVDGLPLFAALFEQAETLTANGGYESASGHKVITEILDRYIE